MGGAPRLSKEQIKALTKRSNARGLLHAGGHVGAAMATGAGVLLLRDTLWVIPLLVLHGYVLNFFFCALHEAAHQTPFRTRWANVVFGHFCAFAIVTPYEFFRLYHWDHHRHTQDPLKDPELMAKRIPRTVGQYLWHVSGIPNWRRRLGAIWGHAVTGRATQPFIPKEKERVVVRQARVYLGLYALLVCGSLAVGSGLVFWLWLLPLVVGHPFLSNYLLCEHTGCEASSDTWRNTRTTYTNVLVRFFAWNMPYHVEHHLYPAVPFHKLAELNAITAPHLTTAAPGYLAAVRGIVGGRAGARSAPPATAA